MNMFKTGIKSPQVKAFTGLVILLCLTGCETLGGEKKSPFSISGIQDGSLYPGGVDDFERDQVKAEDDSRVQTQIIANVTSFYDANPNYASLAKALSESGFSSGVFSVESRKLSSRAHKQSRLPQTRPDLTVDQDGNAVGRLLFEQILIGSGRLRAEKIILNAQEAQALAEYRIEANEDIANGLSIYLKMARSKTLAEESNSIVGLYESFLEKADARVRGGVANRNEARLFELKTAQAKAQQLEFVAEYERYKAELGSLTNNFFPDEELDRMNFQSSSDTGHVNYVAQIQNSPIYQLKLAQLDQTVAEAEKERVSRRPELSLTGSFGGGSSLGLGSDNNINNARLGLTVSKPIVWGKDLNLKAMEANVKASEAVVLKQIRDVENELKSLDVLLKSYEAQLAAKKSVADLADQRATSFEGDFKAGAVSIVEAVSVLETVKTVKLDYVDMKFLLLEAELLKAQTIGVLGPFTEAASEN